jgi:ATP-binding cassette subfamily C protein
MYMATLLSVVAAWKVAVAFVLMLSISVTQGAQLLLLVPLMQLIGLDVEQGSLGWPAKLVTSVFSAIGVRPTLVAVLCAFMLFTTVLALVRWYQTIFNFKLQEEFVATLRQRLYRAIANTDWLTFSRSRASDFTHALTIEIGRIGAATVLALGLMSSIVLTGVYVLFAFQLSKVMTTMVFVAGAVLLLVLRNKMRFAERTGEEVSLASNGLYAAAIEHLAGMKTTKSYGAQDRSAGIFSGVAQKVARMNLNTVRNQADTAFWFGTGSVAILCVLLYAAFEVLSMAAAELLLLLFIFNRIIPLLGGIQQSYQQCLNVLPAFVTVMNTLTRCEKASDLKGRSREKIELGEGVRFRDVSFSYDGEGKAPAIRDLNLDVRAGETTAIVGPSGAGKSTIADLVMGLIVPDQGHVLVDGMPLGAERLQSWRDQIGYVAQDTFLFNDTVRANLLWAHPKASGEEIDQALGLAAADEFVSSLPEGLETVLGDRGVRLSGGERQRLSLARGLLRKPSLLILDEATSALDSENEKRIQSAIDDLHGSMTILIITHRLSTIRGADVIHVLENGRLVESGDWKTLGRRPASRFAALSRAQGIDGGLEPDGTVNPSSHNDGSGEEGSGSTQQEASTRVSPQDW